ncbi:type I-F CRISPR-associated protein Csy1 [Thioalkalivibrio sp. AKL8]|uniref:type I-F CRISPR-associated protein Csy1 n=1 Tax=Thioalkalivibrio sp. AKL8 TaxID=1158156 RepID=UPI001E41611D|nr:type I-F CRISPR-associated protein Csy1 [Thioalkalivibrio sp. AKL8]
MSLPDIDTIHRWFSQQLVHFSFKVVNTNIAPGGGVRISQNQALDRPHVCARTYLCESPAAAGAVLSGLDSIANISVSGPARHNASERVTIGPAKLLKAVRLFRGEAVKLDSPPEADLAEQAEVTDAYLDVASKSPAVINGDRLSPRLRQILLPREDGYLAVTPLTSTGVGLAVNEAIRARDDAFFASRKAAEAPSTRRIPLVPQFSVGGSKPQNAGARVGEWTKRPLVFDSVPTLDRELKRAFHLAYAGFRYRLPVKLVAEHQAFLGQLQLAGEDDSSGIVWTVRNREREAAYLMALWQAIENQAASVRSCLRQHEDDLPSPLPALEKQPMLEGWIDPERRSREWRETVSREVAASVVTMVRSSSFSPHRVCELDDEDGRRMAETLAQGGA